MSNATCPDCVMPLGEYGVYYDRAHCLAALTCYDHDKLRCARAAHALTRAELAKAEAERDALRVHWEGNAFCEGQRRAEKAEAEVARLKGIAEGQGALRANAEAARERSDAALAAEREKVARLSEALDEIEDEVLGITVGLHAGLVSRRLPRGCPAHCDLALAGSEDGRVAGDLRGLEREGAEHDHRRPRLPLSRAYAPRHRRPHRARGWLDRAGNRLPG